MAWLLTAGGGPCMHAGNIQLGGRLMLLRKSVAVMGNHGTDLDGVDKMWADGCGVLGGVGKVMEDAFGYLGGARG